MAITQKHTQSLHAGKNVYDMYNMYNKSNVCNTLNTLIIAAIFIFYVSPRSFAEADVYADISVYDIDNDSANLPLPKRLEILPLYGFEQDVRMFSLHKNRDFRERYFLAAKSDFHARILSVSGVLHFGMRYSSEIGAGLQNRVMAFDPRETNYTVMPYLSVAIDPIYYEIGLDHSCFHLIDRAENGSPYWNRAYASVSSSLNAFPSFPIRWQAGAGYFVRETAGLDPMLLSGNHAWDFSALVKLGSTLYENGWFKFDDHASLEMFADTSGKAYCASQLGVSADFRKDNYTFGVFTRYNREFPRSLPFGSKDRLLEWGVKFGY